MSTLSFLRTAEDEYGEGWECLAFPWLSHEPWIWDDPDDHEYPAVNSSDFDGLFIRALQQQDFLSVYPRTDPWTPQMQVVLQALCQTLEDILPLKVTLRRYQDVRLDWAILQLRHASSGMWAQLTLYLSSPSNIAVASWGRRLEQAFTAQDEAALRQFCQEMLASLDEECGYWDFNIENKFPVDLDLFYSLWMLNTISGTGAN